HDGRFCAQCGGKSGADSERLARPRTRQEQPAGTRFQAPVFTRAALGDRLQLALARRFRLDELVGVFVDATGAQPEFPGRVRPDGEVLAAILLVPALATGRPYGAFQAGLDFLVEFTLYFGADIEVIGVVLLQRLHAFEDVVHLALDHEDDAVVAERGVRADQLVQVRVAADRGAEVGLGAIFPVLAQLVSGQAGEREVLHVDARVDDKAGAEDDAVGRALNAVTRDGAVLAYFLDAVSDQLDIVAVEHRVPLVGNQHALAANGVVRRQLLRQRLVLHLDANEGVGQILQCLGQRRVEDRPDA